MSATCETCRFFAYKIARDGTLIYSQRNSMGYCARPVKTWWGGNRPLNEHVDNIYFCGEHQPKEPTP